MLVLRERTQAPALDELPVARPIGPKPDKRATLAFLSVVLAFLFSISWLHANKGHDENDVDVIVRACRNQLHLELSGRISSTTNRYFIGQSKKGKYQEVFILCKIENSSWLKKVKCVDTQDCWGIVILNFRTKKMTTYIRSLNSSPDRTGKLDFSLEYLAGKVKLEEMPTDQVLAEMQKMMSDFITANGP